MSKLKWSTRMVGNRVEWFSKDAGYVITQKDGRRNRYQVQAHLPVPEPGTREPAVREVVALFAARNQAGTELPLIAGSLFPEIFC